MCAWVVVTTWATFAQQLHGAEARDEMSDALRELRAACAEIEARHDWDTAPASTDSTTPLPADAPATLQKLAQWHEANAQRGHDFARNG